MNIKNNKNCKITINDEEIAVSEKEKTADVIKIKLKDIAKLQHKIKELKQEKGKYGNCLIEMYEDELVNRTIKILQELLESEE